MNLQELTDLVEILKALPQESQDRGADLFLKAMLNSQGQGTSFGDAKKQEVFQDYFFVEFTEEEISNMPTRFRKEFWLEGNLVKCRKRKSGSKHINYEIRYNRNGHHIDVSSNNFHVAKEKFLLALKNEGTKKEAKLPCKFSEFANYYFENYRKRKVTKITYENDSGRLKNHIIPYFKNKSLKDIKPFECQQFIDMLAAKSTKTSNECYSLLNGIFKYAIAQGLITSNPLSIIIISKHNRKHGTALTKEEEAKLLSGTENTRYQKLFAIVLYTGLRPNEYKTARIERPFIIAKNSKRKNGKIEYKRIPISPMLEPFIKDVVDLKFPAQEYMADKLHEFLPNHKLYDLRTTFYTRCEECGVAPAARDEFVGHSRGELNEAYSDLSDEYLLEEGKKLVW